MEESEMFDKIYALNDEDSELEACEDVFQSIIEEADFDTIGKDEMLKAYKGLIIELKGLHSEAIGLYLEKIIEARAT